MVSLEELRELARQAVQEPKDALGEADLQLIRVGVSASVTSLDRPAVAQAIAGALSAGATPVQINEILSLVSGLGVHSLMVASTVLVEQAQAAGFAIPDALTPEQEELWQTHVGDDPFWAAFEEQLPGFLRAMLVLSPDQFAAFFHYCAVPWKSGQVRARIKELTAMACDATPGHRFLPGFRLHLANAVALGAGRLAIEQVMDIAAAVPVHAGTR